MINCNDDILTLNPRDVVRHKMKKNDDTIMYNNEYNGNIPAIESDNFLLYTNVSSLPSSKYNGLGVFAKRTISKDSIICEYKGDIVDHLHKTL